MKTKTLIVYEDHVFETTTIFLIDGARHDLQGKYVNMTDCELTTQQYNELTDPEKYFGKPLVMPLTLMTDIVVVVNCGHLL